MADLTESGGVSCACHGLVSLPFDIVNRDAREQAMSSREYLHSSALNVLVFMVLELSWQTDPARDLGSVNSLSPTDG